MIEHRNEKGELHRVDGPAIERPDGVKEAVAPESKTEKGV